MKKTSGFYTKKISRLHPCSLSYKVVCVDDNFMKQIVFYRGESTYKFIETIREEFHYLNKY